MGVGSDIQDWSPYHLSPSMYVLLQSIWNPLIYYVPGTGDFEPALAESWDVSSDAKSVTLELKKGVLFHSGREFTADDVVKSLELRQTADAADNYGAITKRATGAEVLDKYTVRIDFDPPTGPIIPWLETFFIVDHETWLEPMLGTGGTGPFRVKEYLPDVGVTMERFEDYWEEGLPFVDSFVTKVIPDRATLGINFEAGEIDACWEMDIKDFARWREDPNFGTDIGASGFAVTAICMNVTNGPTSDKKFRQAVAHAVDRERYVANMLQGVGYPTDILLPPMHPAYPADLAGNLGYDLDKARALVEEAGMDGVDVEILTSSEFKAAYGPLSQMMADDLGKIGVKATVSDLERSAYLSRFRAPDFQISMISPARQSKDPAVCFAAAKILWPDAENYMQFYSEEYEQLFNEVIQEPDLGKRTEIFHRMTEIMQDECFCVPVAPEERPYAYQNYVKNFAVEDDLAPYVGRLYLDQS